MGEGALRVLEDLGLWLDGCRTATEKTFLFNVLTSPAAASHLDRPAYPAPPNPRRAVEERNSMFRGKTRLRAPALLIAALAALLVFAAAASAETRTGESSTPRNSGGLTPGATLVKASASYDTTSGNVGFSVTTAGEPQAKTEDRPSEASMLVGLSQATSGCDFAAFDSGSFLFPAFQVVSRYAEREASEAVLFQSSTVVEELGAAVPSVSGTTTTFSFASSRLANQGWNCAVAETGEGHEGANGLLIFPISVPRIPPAPPATPAPPAAPAPAPAPPVLSIAKAKPLNLKVGKSKTVKVKVTNTGATATAQGSLRMKPTKGVLVTPETQKLPALAPGASWSVSVRVKLTEKAKPKSTLSLTGTASGVTAKGSLVVKLTE
jgi:hypothetical protein